MSDIKLINEHVIEIRFKPDARILDKRGEIANLLTVNPFDQWNISTNKINFLSKDNPNLEAYFSFKNTGLISSYPNETKSFIEETEKFIKTVWNHFPTNEITRVGIRSRYVLPAKDFKTMFDAYKEKFLGIKDDDLKKLGGDLIDLGFPLNFVDGENFFNIHTGPMEKKEFSNLVKNQDEIFDNGVFLDFDFFKEKFSPYTKQKDIVDFLKLGVKKAENALSVISGWIIKE